MLISRRILIIDDDRDFVAVYDEMFKNQGLIVTAAYSAAEATQVLETAGAGVDVVLLDQKLQGHGGPDSGLEMISRIEQLAPFAKTIVVTGYASPDAVERAFRLGSTYLLGECKNWSKKCGSAEFRGLYEKLTTKYRRAHTGFFIAPGGFTDEFHTARAKHGSEAALVIPVDGADLERWIHADDRLTVLGELHRRAVFDLKR